MIALALWILCAGASEPTSLDDARARRQLAPYLGSFATPDHHSRATVVIADGRLEVWQIEGDAPARESFAVEHALIGETSSRRATDATLGWHTVERFLYLADDWLIYSVRRTGTLRRITEQWGLRVNGDGVDFHHQRVFEHRGVFDFGAWYVDSNSREASVLSENVKLHMVRLSAKPIPVAEFVRLVGTPQPPPAPPPEMGRVIPFPTCERVLDR